MRSAVTLYEFMPYGAPELLESLQRDMSRALALTSLLAVVAAALAVGLVPRLSVAPVDVHEIAVGPTREITPPPLVDPTPAVPRVAVPPKAPPVGVPEPVADEVAPPSEVPTAPPSAIDGTGPTEGVTPVDVGPTGPVTETYPARGEWVYVEQEPVAIREVKPVYPDLARQAGVEGRVTVHVLIGKEGRVLDAEVDKHLQVPMLNTVALEAARRWVFTPGLANGHPVPCWRAIPFHFRLHD